MLSAASNGFSHEFGSVSTPGWLVSCLFLVKSRLCGTRDVFYQDPFSLTVGTFRKVLVPANLLVRTCLRILLDVFRLEIRTNQTMCVNYCNCPEGIFFGVWVRVSVRMLV